MKTLWLTYSWNDNPDNDIDFLVQEIEKKGVKVKLDKWNFTAGNRLWDQIAKHITNENECDGWSIVVTQNSLESEACKEELAYALRRALASRGSDFPIIGILPSPYDEHGKALMIPPAIETRLYVNIEDKDWTERIVAALENRLPNIIRPVLEPYTVTIRLSDDHKHSALEIRPRVGTWAPFFCAIPISEKDVVQPVLIRGPKGRFCGRGTLTLPFTEPSADGNFWIMGANDEATSTMSYFLHFKKLPTQIYFGILDSATVQYVYKP